MPARVVYFNIDGGLDYENQLLAEWGVADKIELVGVTTPDNAEDTFVEAVADADGVLVEYFEVTRAVMERLPKLKVISLQAIGVSNVDLDAATDLGIGVTNTPGFCSEDVALHTVGMIIDLVRKISFLDRSVRAGHWNPMLGGLPTRVSGKTVGLVFFGSIPKLMVPILQAIEITAKTAGNRVISDPMAEVAERVKEGQPLAQPLAKTGVFPIMVTQMLAVGEETGAMDAMLHKLADFYDDEIEARLKSLTSIIEPLMMIMVGVIVGIVVVSMYLPMFKIFELVQ